MITTAIKKKLFIFFAIFIGRLKKQVIMASSKFGMMKKIFCIAIFILNILIGYSAEMQAQSAVASFSLGDSIFLPDIKPFQIISGEMHYPRIPREAWISRMKMAKAMGLNTISTYIFGNLQGRMSKDWRKYYCCPGIVKTADEFSFRDPIL